MSLRWGSIAAWTPGVIVAVCVLGPWLLPDPPAADPVHAALLPPLSRVTEVTFADGRTRTEPVAETATLPADDTTTPSGDRIVRVREARLWLGSDRFGRDVLRDLLVGGRVSLVIAAGAVLVALLAGLTVGLAATSGTGWIDGAMMRIVDALLAFPVLFLVILVAALIQPGPWALVPVLGLTSWMGLARLVRGQVLALRGRGFIQAARVSGATSHQLWRWHYLPNLVGPVGQDVALRAGELVLAEATLSYLGLGVPATIPTWGSMVREGHRVMLDGWWLATFPGIAIAVLVISLAATADRIAARWRRAG
jgi:peptide/nickel transport system permease protein